VMEERDDREAAHVRDILVVLDLREQIVHARREAGDAHLPDVLGLEGCLLRLEESADFREVGLERRDDVVVHREGQALLDVPLDGIPQDPERLLTAQRHVAAFERLVDQLPGGVPHRVRETKEIGEVDAESTVLAAEVHRQLRGDVQDRVVGILCQQALRGDGLSEREAPGEVGVAKGGDHDPRDGIGEQLGQLIRGRNGDPWGFGTLFQGLVHASPPEGSRPGVGGLGEQLLEGHALRADEGGRLPEKRILREARQLHGRRNAHAVKGVRRGGANTADRGPAEGLSATRRLASPWARSRGISRSIPRGSGMRRGPLPSPAASRPAARICTSSSWPASRLLEGYGNRWFSSIARQVDLILTFDDAPPWPNVRRIPPVVRPFSASREKLREDLFLRKKTILVTAGGTAIGEYLLRAAVEA